MRQPPPVKKGESSLLSTLASLATKHQSTLMVMIVNELVTIYPNEVSRWLDLTFYSYIEREPWAVRPLVKLFQNALSKRPSNNKCTIRRKSCYLKARLHRRFLLRSFSIWCMRLNGLTYEFIRPSVQSYRNQYFCDSTTQSHVSEWEKSPM